MNAIQSSARAAFLTLLSELDRLHVRSCFQAGQSAMHSEGSVSVLVSAGLRPDLPDRHLVTLGRGLIPPPEVQDLPCGVISNENGRVVAAARTDSRGQFWIDLRPGRYRLKYVLELHDSVDIEILRQLHDEAAIESLADCLEDDEAPNTVCIQAAEALGQIGSERAVCVLAEALRHEATPDEAREACARALATIGDEHARQVLADALQEDAVGGQIRATCAPALDPAQERAQDIAAAPVSLSELRSFDWGATGGVYYRVSAKRRVTVLRAASAGAVRPAVDGKRLPLAFPADKVPFGVVRVFIGAPADDALLGKALVPMPETTVCGNRMRMNSLPIERWQRACKGGLEVWVQPATDAPEVLEFFPAEEVERLLDDPSVQSNPDLRAEIIALLRLRRADHSHQSTK